MNNNNNNNNNHRTSMSCHTHNYRGRGDNELISPRRNIGKPPAATVRRRFRASRKTPVTLLSANISNFRALVQQYTGCRQPQYAYAKNNINPFLAMPMHHKGPINLSFAAEMSSTEEENDYDDDVHHHHHHHFYHDSTSTSTTTTAANASSISTLPMMSGNTTTCPDQQSMFTFGINHQDVNHVSKPESVSHLSLDDHTLTIDDDDFAADINTCLTW